MILDMQKRAWLLLSLVLVCATYANSFQNEFHFDDFHTIVDNPAIRSLRNIPRFFTDATTFSVLPANRTYRPFVSTSLALDYAMGGGYKPPWFHFSTFLIFLAQLAVMYLLFAALLRRVQPGEQTWPAALAAATWYGVHPAIAETVNYIIQRGDIYSTFGVVAAIALFVCRPQWRSRGLYLLPFVFAMLSKPPAIVFPILLFAYVALFEDEAPARWKHAAKAALPSLAVGIALMILQARMTPKTFAPSSLSAFSYCITQPYVLLRYFGSFFLPLHLSVDSDLNAFTGFTPLALCGFLFLGGLALAIAVTAGYRKLRPVSFGLLWFVVASLPTSIYPLSEVENDHRMYMPFVGLALAVTWTVRILAEKAMAARLAGPFAPAKRNVVAAIALLSLCGYAYGAHVRNTVWRTEDSLWKDNVEKNPHNGRGLMIYGLDLMEQGNYQQALALFQKASIYTPNYATLEMNLGVLNGAMADQGDAARAGEVERHFQRAIALTPGDDNAYALYGRWLMEHAYYPEAIAQLRTAVVLNGMRMLQRGLLIQALFESGDTSGARAAAEDTLRVDPQNPAARQMLEHPPAPGGGPWVQRSLLEYELHEYRQSIASAQRALQIDPRSATAYNNIGADYAQLGDLADAIASEQKAIEIDPQMPIARNNLSAYRRQSAKHPLPDATATADDLLNESLRLNLAGNYPQSIAAARKVLALQPGSAAAWNNIAAGYAGMKQWDKAIDAAHRAIALQPDFQLAKNNLAWAEQEKRAQAAH